MKSKQIMDIKKPVPRFRFAPSPTGGLHIGTARTALFNWLAARSMDGKLILRIEDTDVHRSKKKFEDSIVADLGWLGIKWDEFYRQSDRMALYRKYAEKLLHQNKAYLCFCTSARLDELKKSQYSAQKMSKYDNRCRYLSEEEIDKNLKEAMQYTVRFKVPECEVIFEDFIRGTIRFSSDVFGDFVILKSDGTPSYNFAVVIDDLNMAITHVLRGEDHITNTARQIMIFNSTGSKLPYFGHLSMIIGSDGAKLSKRLGSRTVGEFKDKGYLSEAVGNYLALLSWSPRNGQEIFKTGDIFDDFKIEDISKSPAIFDIDKLNWVNGNHIRSKNDEEVFRLVVSFLPKDFRTQYHIEENDLEKDDKVKTKLMRCVDAFREKIKVLSDFAYYIQDYFKKGLDIYSPEAKEILKTKTSRVVLLHFLEKLKNIVEAGKSPDLNAGKLPVADTDAGHYAAMTQDFFKDLITGLAQELKKADIKGSQFYLPLRSALTGQVHGPELPKVLSILGLDNCIYRTELCISHFYKIDKITEG